METTNETLAVLKATFRKQETGVVERGEYQIQLESAGIGKTRNGLKRMTWTATIMEGHYKGEDITGTLWLTDRQGLNRLRALYKAIGVEYAAGEGGEVDLTGIPFIAYIGISQSPKYGSSNTLEQFRTVGESE